MEHEPIVPAESLGWLEEFRRRHGRPPRVLHIGNVANNAYLSSKLMNRTGLWSDVLCYDYYHIMGCPEWEESNYAGDLGSDFHPAWERVDLRGYQRPRWFAQGPLQPCIQYLVARLEGRPDAEQCWEQMERARIRVNAEQRGEWTNQGPVAAGSVRVAPAPVHRLPRLRRLLGPAYQPLRSAAWQVLDGCRTAPRITRKLLQRVLPTPRARAARQIDAQYEQRVLELCQAYAELFPERHEALRRDDLNYLPGSYRQWEQLIHRYDVVIGYSTDGVFPLLVNSCPYLALEHGTLRNIPFQDDSQGKLCALTFRLAAEALITNCDNFDAADKLRLQRCRFLPHPLNEDLQPAVPAETLRQEICQRLQCDFFLFHPARQHWTADRHPDWEKGNDILIEGLATFRRSENPRVGAVFVDWGVTVAESRALLERLGLSDRVLWIPPQPIPRMLDYVRACDVLADQFYLGAFGSITPKAWMLGVPTLLYLHEAQHRRCFPVLPPVVNARTPEEVCAGLTRLYRDPGYGQRLREEGVRWYEQFHSNRVILGSLLEALGKILLTPSAARVA